MLIEIYTSWRKHGTLTFYDKGSHRLLWAGSRAIGWKITVNGVPTRLSYCVMLTVRTYFDVLLKVHLSIFISIFNKLDAQNLFHNKFYFMPLHVSSTCAHHQEVKITLHSLWYHHTYSCDDTRGCVMQFWPPDDEQMCSKRVEAWNKTYCETNFEHQVG